jgi:cobalt-zinc-cadmium efflux system outer membrane protein
MTLKRFFTGALLIGGLHSPALLAQEQPESARMTAPAVPQRGGLTMDDAVQIALRRNRDVIAARLDVEAAEYDKVAAKVYPNPVLSYQVGDLVLGRGNSQGQNPPLRPGLFSQPVQSVGISELIDIWAKRQQKTQTAEQGLRYRRLLLEDVLREVAYAVRSAYAEVLRQRSELQFTIEVRDRYQQTVQLSHARFAAGEISESEFRKIELEGLKYHNAVIDEQTQRDLAVQSLAAVMGFAAADELPDIFDAGEVAPLVRSVTDLTTDALKSRPDMRALAEGRRYASTALSSARREAYPDLTVGVTYTHSAFEASGDNPNTVAVGFSMPLPLFDRNQANIGRGEIDIRRFDNDRVRLSLQIQHEVAAAVRNLKRAESLLTLFKEGGMLERAETSLRVAEKSYKAGAVSLLEFLEAQRTYLEIHDEYLHALYDKRRSEVDLVHALGKKP